jgi:predicted MFS family arabinose efflux permease
MPPHVVTELRGTVSRYLSVLAHPAGREVMVAVFIEGFLLFGGSAFLGALLHDRYGLSLTRVGAMLVCVGLGSLIYTASVGWLMRRLGQRAMIAAGGVLMFVCFAALANARTALIAAPALLLLGLAIYLMHNTLQMLATELAPEARGTSVSLMAFMLFAGQAAGAFCLGFAIDRIGYSTCYTALAIALVLLGTWLQGTRAVRRGPLTR